LADANMLNKLSPFFALVFSAFILKEKPRPAQLAFFAAAFAGSLLIIRPTAGLALSVPSLVGLAGGAAAGLAYTCLRRLGRQGADAEGIIFFFSLFSCLVCIPLMLPAFVMPDWRELVCLVLAGGCACAGQFGVTKAYSFAPAKEISVYDYTQVIFAALIGFFVFDQIPEPLSFAGYALIVGSGVAMFLYNKKR
nr:DMT family transporter [Clostridia bacterium]